LKVIARTSSFSFRAKETDIAQIRERLKVQSILEGSVRKSRNRLRVTERLINTADESHLWSERFDREMTDVFAIQDEISQAIAMDPNYALAWFGLAWLYALLGTYGLMPPRAANDQCRQTAQTGADTRRASKKDDFRVIRDNKHSVSCFFSKIVSRRSLECASLRASKLAGAFAADYS
jgi:hypothetical protein